MESSTTLRQRTEETQGEILALQVRLQALLVEKQAVLAAPVVDAKALAKLEMEEQRIPLAVESLQTRLTLLANQIEEALKAEALQRVAEIEKEHTAIAARINGRREAFLNGLDQLVQLIQADHPDRQRCAELSAEANYLHVAYTAPAARVPPPVALQENDLVRLTPEFRKNGWLRDAGREWTEKTNAIQQQRARDARAALDSQRQQVVTTRPVTLHAKV